MPAKEGQGKSNIHEIRKQRFICSLLSAVKLARDGIDKEAFSSSFFSGELLKFLITELSDSYFNFPDLAGEVLEKSLQNCVEFDFANLNMFERLLIDLDPRNTVVLSRQHDGYKEVTTTQQSPYVVFRQKRRRDSFVLQHVTDCVAGELAVDNRNLDYLPTYAHYLLSFVNEVINIAYYTNRSAKLVFYQQKAVYRYLIITDKIKGEGFYGYFNRRLYDDSLFSVSEQILRYLKFLQTNLTDFAGSDVRLKNTLYDGSNFYAIDMTYYRFPIPDHIPDLFHPLSYHHRGPIWLSEDSSYLFEFTAQENNMPRLWRYFFDEKKACFSLGMTDSRESPLYPFFNFGEFYFFSATKVTKLKKSIESSVHEAYSSLMTFLESESDLSNQVEESNFKMLVFFKTIHSFLNNADNYENLSKIEEKIFHHQVLIKNNLSELLYTLTNPNLPGADQIKLRPLQQILRSLIEESIVTFPSVISTLCEFLCAKNSMVGASPVSRNSSSSNSTVSRHSFISPSAGHKELVAGAKSLLSQI